MHITLPYCNCSDPKHAGISGSVHMCMHAIVGRNSKTSNREDNTCRQNTAANGTAVAKLYTVLQHGCYSTYLLVASSLDEARVTDLTSL